jgi:hypothetical protein
MSYPAQIVYVDLQSSRVFSNSTGTAMAWPTFLAGGLQNIGIRFLTSNGAGGYVVDTQYAARCASIRMGIGVMDESPVSGTYSIQIAEGITALLPYNANSKKIQDSLNALVTTNLFHCEQDATGVYISRADGSTFTINAVNNTVLPQSFMAFRGLVTNQKTKYKMTFEAAPLAFTTGADQILPPAPVVTVIQHGGSDPSGAIWPTIQNLYIPPTFLGTFQLSDNDYKTILMDITDGATSVQNNLNTMYNPKGLGYTVSVTNPTSYNLHITFDGYTSTGGFLGMDVPPLGVNVYSAPPGDWTVSLDLDTIPLQEYLRGAGSKKLQFEAEADFYVTNPIQDQPLPATFRKKLWSTSVTVAEPLIRPEFQTAQALQWLEPPAGKTYVPFSPNQILTGQQNYSATFGDGNASIFNIAHNLNVNNIASVLVRENKNNGKMLVEGTDYTIIFVDANSMNLTFVTPPTQNQYAVTILAAPPTSAFVSNITVTTAQVVLLDDKLTALSNRIAYLENLVPRSPTSLAVSTNQPDQVSIVPTFGEMLPDLALENTNIPAPLPAPVAGQPAPAVPTAPQATSIASQLVASGPAAPATVVPGTDLQAATQAAAAELAQINAQIAAAQAAATAAAAATQAQQTAQQTSKAIVQQANTQITTYNVPAIGTTSGTTTTPMYWPPSLRNGKLQRLPAIQRSAPTSVSSVPQISAPGVYQASTAITIPPAAGRKSFNVQSGGYFASDGIIFYPVASTGANNTWYAIEMDRELSRTLIPSQAFPDQSTLSATFAINTNLNTPGFDHAGINYGCEYTLRVLAIPLSNGVAGNPAVILSTPIAFSPASEARSFSITAVRDGSNSSATVYGKQIKGDPIPSGDIVFVVDLTAFDVDATTTPVGQVGMTMQATQITITNA